MKPLRIALILLPVSLACALAACTKKEPEVAYNVTLPVKEVMGHDVDVGAQKFWCASGDVITVEGTKSRAPTTQEGWEDAISGATIVAEAGNLLKLPGRARDNGDWMKFATQLTDAAMEGRAGAEAHDVDKVFATGGKIYEVCTACHAKYLLPFVDTKTGEPIKGGPLDTGKKEEASAEPPSPDFKCAPVPGEIKAAR